MPAASGTGEVPSYPAPPPVPTFFDARTASRCWASLPRRCISLARSAFSRRRSRQRASRPALGCCCSPIGDHPSWTGRDPTPPHPVALEPEMPRLPRALPGFTQGRPRPAQPLTTGQCSRATLRASGSNQRSLVDGRLDAEPAAEATRPLHLTPSRWAPSSGNGPRGQAGRVDAAGTSTSRSTPQPVRLGCPPTTRASSPASTRSPTSSASTGWSRTTARTRPTTASRRGEGTRRRLVVAHERPGPRSASTTVPARSARRCSGTPRRSIYAEEIDARSGRHLGNPPAGTSPTWSSSTSMHVVRADHELAAAQPLLGTRRGVPAT
jgi:hypothetical protein